MQNINMFKHNLKGNGIFFNKKFSQKLQQFFIKFSSVQYGESPLDAFAAVDVYMVHAPAMFGFSHWLALFKQSIRTIMAGKEFALFWAKVGRNLRCPHTSL